MVGGAPEKILDKQWLEQQLNMGLTIQEIKKAIQEQGGSISIRTISRRIAKWGTLLSYSIE